MSLPWARWPWQACPACTAKGERCDLKKGHTGPHVAERGMYHLYFYVHVEARSP